MAVGGSLVICSSFIRTFSPIDDKVAKFKLKPVGGIGYDHIFFLTTTDIVAISTACRGTLRRLAVDIATSCRRYRDLLPSIQRRSFVDIATLYRRKYWGWDFSI